MSSKRTKRGVCPFADTTVSPAVAGVCPYHAHAALPPPTIKKEVRFESKSGRYVTSEKTTRLLADIGGADTVRIFCTRFYARFLADTHLRPFSFLDDGAVMHADRLATFLVQEMGGDVPVPSPSFGAAHYKARYSSKRHPSVRGRPFSLVDARIWMRLHFWAVRECGLQRHRAFWKWYVAFIGHHIRLYEKTSAAFAKDDAEWSSDTSAIDAYLANGNVMTDLVV
ncbi:hypothetical protein SDRG_11469 [Saprolegnia diclina VS20]|uniref:Uncharacterized protein n=1 Tax=Saprolegnia diclina (strain VS20) TaxID=1156394 RepID=T0QB00_SAPDV|nr:hypothetical protein SDRG_11469 [Saprolegnia diclina VS20]EQC30710.1 hypothetical protein SDRG_11469 [Saprolegnia diclina VS20]|eukprot:XP_008615734.1 hypothetical protein SDRG_11469 [Saprolegnia diclina VS20]